MTRIRTPQGRRPRRRDDALTVAMTPADHVFGRHILPRAGGPGDGDVQVLPAAVRPEASPTADRDAAAPAALTPEWIAAADFDLLHLHTGFEALDLDALAAVVDALRRAGRPLVHTVHDLTDPFRHEQGHHTDQLAFLVKEADAVLTLTEGAADEVEQRWGRRPQVVPHPHVVPLHRIDDLRAARQARDWRPQTVAVPWRDLRASGDLRGVLAPLERLAAELPHTRLAVAVRSEIMHERRHMQVCRTRLALIESASAGRLRLSVHPRLNDEQLWQELAGVDVVVLPYRHGTHSTWLEACLDVGTSVVAPDVGHYGEQGADSCYRVVDGAVDEDSLRRSVVHAFATRRLALPGRDAAARRAQRDRIAGDHLAVYRAVTGR